MDINNQNNSPVNDTITNSNEVKGTEKSDYDYAETESKLIDEIQKIKQNADSYGDVVQVVGRRPKVADSNGRGNGYAYEYKLSDGRVVSNDEAWTLANAGKLQGVTGSHNHGRKFIRGVGDGQTDNNLGNLPGF